jgi:hypothetical protein
VFLQQPYGTSSNVWYIMSYVQDIINLCGFPAGDIKWAGGQEFDTAGYNVIAGNTNRDC